MYTNGAGGTHMVAQTLKKMADEKIRSPTGNIGEHDATRPTRDPPHATPPELLANIANDIHHPSDTSHPTIAKHPPCIIHSYVPPTKWWGSS